MFNSIFLFSAETVLFLIATSDYAVSSPASTLFSDEGLISYEDKNGTISESIMSSIRCAAKCLQDLSSNPIELCSTPSGQTCRLGRGLKNTGGTLSQATCRRFQIVGECGREGYIDRRFGICTYEHKFIHQLTADGHIVLRIELEDHDGIKRYAEYSSFTVADVTDNYRIQVSGYTGNAGNSLRRSCAFCNNGMPFSMYDRDNENYDMNCAVWSNGGWWHSRFQNSCLNGLYGDDRYRQGVNWEDWKTLNYSLKSSVMKVRKP